MLRQARLAHSSKRPTRSDSGKHLALPAALCPTLSDAKTLLRRAVPCIYVGGYQAGQRSSSADNRATVIAQNNTALHMGTSAQPNGGANMMLLSIQYTVYTIHYTLQYRVHLVFLQFRENEPQQKMRRNTSHRDVALHAARCAVGACPWPRVASASQLLCAIDDGPMTGVESKVGNSDSGWRLQRTSRTF